MKLSEDAGLPWQLPPSVWGKRHILPTHLAGHIPIFQPLDPSLHLASQFPVYTHLLNCV